MFSRFAIRAWAFSVVSLAHSAPVEFNRDIRPILSDRCYTCHGPASSTRKSKLRFDTEAGAKQDLGGGRFAIVPGDAERSEMLKRISAKGSPVRMPPPYSGPELTERETNLIRTWIAEGAKWEKHWSFISPKRSALPPVSDPKWLRNPIDGFVLAKLDREGLKPSPEAGKIALLRRVSLDLTGLPPTLAEIDAFIRDPSPGGYEKAVDRLLDSPRYGERMAARWLDAARYADTNGYQTDGERSMWRWRDWVINAFNTDMPYDRFAVEQLAGDLLPHPTLDQRIATGFNRNHRGNGEGGIVPEEYAVEYVVDRVDTTSTVFLGLTAGCARCHDHKYDPITQKEFYQLYAYFNNIPERGNAQKYGNSPPFVQAPTPAQEQRIKDFDELVAKLTQDLNANTDRIAREQRTWEAKLSPGSQWFPSRALAASFAPEEAFDGTRVLNGGDKADFGFYDKFTISAWIQPAASDGALVTRAKDEAQGSGYSVLLSGGKVQVNLVLRWLDDALRVETEDTIALDHWHHIAATYDGSRFATGLKIFVDGKQQKCKINLDQLNQNFSVKAPVLIGSGAGAAKFRGKIEDVRFYSAALPPPLIGILATRPTLSDLAALAPERRSEAEREKLRRAFLEQFAPPDLRETWRVLEQAREDRDRFLEAIPTVMVMQERPVPRDTFVLVRGAYDHPGTKVGRGVPAVLPPLPQGVSNDRLGLARWVVDPSNPLTARVAVNRFWQSYFGAGLVKTVEDFGSQGEWPSHPELLDWLATEFVRTGWDVKRMQKLIVTSATYRQSSAISPELLQRDPDNRLLARGPRFRLPAEMIRDQALSVSGLLVEKVGGPSVKPYQPAGLWKELSGGEDYQQDRGDNLYRRSLYTFWKRASPPPMMTNFDAPGREACTVREARTNTPLQALDLMNDVTFVEASRVLAQRMMKEGGTSEVDRIAYGFRLVTSRQPGDAERPILSGAYRNNLERFRSDPARALALISQGESRRDPSLNAGELAAFTAVASLIFNMDETVTRQ